MALPSLLASPTRLFLPLLALGLAACSPQQMMMRGVADQLAAQAQNAEDDLDLAREASAFYLKLSESVLRGQPEHTGLATAVAGGFTQYAYAFVAFEADRIETTDARAAQRLRERAARLYLRARNHALNALEKTRPGFRQALESTAPGDWPRLEAHQVALAYWAAAAWGGAISLSKDKPDLVADLPVALRLARLAFEQDPSFGQGELMGLMATFEAARPNGNLRQAAAWFDEAIRLSGGLSAGTYLAKAESIAQPAGDKSGFLALLDKALAIEDAPGSPRALVNEVMRRRALWLKESADDLF
ncbi:TRAP transporter TatT component family protein [Zoogloea sp.]|uniref:TRAP transporter TatT component family protein n=1 Tax=Zoogloea sp. TaxID=49181 RepID=UPI002639711E|nr:TRAP transporter TatT component family protein [Zoogloea sp.]MDD3352620.1 TRAP transporter TatT component family protein [Zoogloea sp.]